MPGDRAPPCLGARELELARRIAALDNDGPMLSFGWRL
jgi:hypothetical protein